MNLQMWREQITRREEALAAANAAADVARNASRSAGQTQIEATALRRRAEAARAPEALRAAKRLAKAARRAYLAACAAEDAAAAHCQSVRFDVVAAKAAAWDAQAFEAAEAAADAAEAAADAAEEELTQEDLERLLSGDLGFMQVDEDGYPAISGGPIVW